MADDLDDEWWLKGDNAPRDEKSSDSTEENQSQSDKKIQDVKRKKAKKRKANDHDGEKDEINGKKKLKKVPKIDETLVKSDEEKPKKKKKKKRARKRISEEISGKTLNPAEKDDFLQLLKKTYEGKLSTVEWDEIQLEAADFLMSNPSSDGTAPCSYLQSVVPDWPSMVASEDLKPGTPFMLIIASSGARAVELNRDIQKFKGKDCKCAKLFAKHFKLAEQVQFLAKKVCHLGIGTPNRIGALIKSGSLKVDNLRYVMVDWNWRDIKFKRIIDIPEVKKDLLELCKSELIPHIRDSSCKIGIL
ncbi:protein CMSS1-like [Haliotis cracherodii]|uniref:protein CMSS1-like n=1 Tax=Haliotis cracherodii TaxID=6455 RepID=UPI0039EBBE2A